MDAFEVQSSQDGDQEEKREEGLREFKVHEQEELCSSLQPQTLTQSMIQPKPQDQLQKHPALNDSIEQSQTKLQRSVDKMEEMKQSQPSQHSPKA